MTIFTQKKEMLRQMMKGKKISPTDQESKIFSTTQNKISNVKSLIGNKNLFSANASSYTHFSFFVIQSPKNALYCLINSPKFYDVIVFSEKYEQIILVHRN